MANEPKSDLERIEVQLRHVLAEQREMLADMATTRADLMRGFDRLDTIVGKIRALLSQHDRHS